MITLHHCPRARSFRVLWTLEELGIPYTLKMEPFPPRFRSENYLEINPLGTVPTFFDGAHRMTESTAICQYLVTRNGPTPLAVAPEEAGYADYLNFLVMGEATLTFPQTIYLRYAMFEPDERKNPQAATDYTAWFAARLKAAFTFIPGPYVAADRFTIADISMGYAIMLANGIGIGHAVCEPAQAYFEHLKQREGFLRAVAAEAQALQG